MFENTKCECGHQNPVGTILCESCGKPTENEESTEPLEMRYDGMARISQRANPTILNRVWNFFSSVKIAVYLIVITLVAAAIGTIFPQESMFLNMQNPLAYYKANYGFLGQVYYWLGFSRTFETWWFITLLFMIGTSLVVCSLDRVLPLYRALSKQQIRKHLLFLTRQKVSYQGKLPEENEQLVDEQVWVDRMAHALSKKRYRVHREGTALLAEKNRFSRWGPYINHIGLIIFLLAVLARYVPGWHMDEHMSFMEGEITKIPNTPYYLKNEKFIVEFYTESEMVEEFRERNRTVAKHFETQAVLYTCESNCDDPLDEPVLKEVHRQNIIVNKPLSYKGLLAYQFDYSETPMLLGVKPKIVNVQTGEETESFQLSTKNPQEHYEVGPYSLELRGYFPEFGLDESGQPITLSNEPNAPAFIFLVKGPNLAEAGEGFMYFPREIDRENYRQHDINGEIAQKIDFRVDSMEDVDIAFYTSVLNIRKDLAIPYIWVGAGISMLGLIMGFYWHHRRIWLRVDEHTLTLGAYSNKNWHGIREDVAQALAKTGIEVDPKSLELGGKKP